MIQTLVFFLSFILPSILIAQVNQQDKYFVQISASINKEDCLIKKQTTKIPSMSRLKKPDILTQFHLRHANFKKTPLKSPIVGISGKEFRLGVKIFNLEGGSIKNIRVQAQVDNEEIEFFLVPDKISGSKHAPKVYQYSIRLPHSPKPDDVVRVPVTVLFDTQNGPKDFSITIFVVSNKKDIRLADLTRTCSRISPPILASKKYTNHNAVQNATVEHKSREQKIERENGTNFVGLGLITEAEHTTECPDDWHQHDGYLAGIGLRFFTIEEWYLQQQDDFEIGHRFTLRAGESGYIVEQLEEILAPYKDYQFDSCGHLEPKHSKGFEDRMIVDSVYSHSFFNIKSNLSNDLENIKQKINENYPQMNSCEEM